VRVCVYTHTHTHTHGRCLLVLHGTKPKKTSVTDTAVKVSKKTMFFRL
jgi:hypothetical protein